MKDIGPRKYGQMDTPVDVSGRVYTGDECDGGSWDVVVKKGGTNTTGGAGDGQTQTQVHPQLRLPTAVHLQMQTLAQGQIPTPPHSGVVPRRFLGRKRSDYGWCQNESGENGETLTREEGREEMVVRKDMGHVDEGVGLVDGRPQGMQPAVERPLDGMSQDEAERRAIAVAVLLQVGGRG
ncbi:hypothetical protein HDU85_005057 [Gaertneriomyces sp. JEL0708]|nr:hypothetical protein HDU85_005057 [Gaertneriomyces sp. JEL0708]